jgi:hypothetical protein
MHWRILLLYQQWRENSVAASDRPWLNTFRRRIFFAFPRIKSFKSHLEQESAHSRIAPKFHRFLAKCG